MHNGCNQQKRSPTVSLFFHHKCKRERFGFVCTRGNCQLLYTCCAFPMQPLLCSFFLIHKVTVMHRRCKGALQIARIGKLFCTFGASEPEVYCATRELEITAAGYRGEDVQVESEEDRKPMCNTPKDWRMCTFTPEGTAGV